MYNDAGEKKTEPILVHSADHAFHLSKKVWKDSNEAYAVTLDTFADGSFVTRVMSKQRMIFKLEFNN